MEESKTNALSGDLVFPKLDRSTTLASVLVVMGYGACVIAGHKLTLGTGMYPPVSLAAGVALFAVTTIGWGAVVPIFLGGAVANILEGASLGGALGPAVGNAAGALITAWIFGFWQRPGRDQNAFADTVIWSIAVSIGCGAAALNEAFFLRAFGLSADPEFFQTALKLWSGEVLGGLLMSMILRELSQTYAAHGIVSKAGSWSILRALGVASIVTAAYIWTERLGLQTAGMFLAFIGFLLLTPAGPGLDAALSLIGLTAALLTTPMFDPKIEGVDPRNSAVLLAQIKVFACYVTFAATKSLHGAGAQKTLRWALMIGWVTAAVITGAFETGSRRNQARELADEANQLEERVRNTFERYVQELRAAEGLFRIWPDISPGKWETFVQTLDVFRRMPAVANFGAIIPVPEADVPRHEAAFAAAHGAPFHVHPVPGFSNSQGTLYVISYIEPRERNLAALGLDVRSEPRRREAAETALRTRSATMTAPIQLVQDSVKRPAFLLLSPVIHGPERHHWVYSPVISELFYREIEKASSRVLFSISDAEFESEGAIYQSASFSQLIGARAPLVNRTVKIGGRDHKLSVLMSHAFSLTGMAYESALSLILALLVMGWSSYVSMLDSVRHRAQALAESISGELEQQRAKSQYAAKMSALGEMAGGVAHEVNNPLAVISALSQQIQRAIKSGKTDPAMLLEKTEKIEKTTERISKIVKGLRSFSRNAEQDPLTDQSISKIIADSLELCSERFKQRDIKLKVDIEDAWVHCRPVEISQVILNLLNNAYDAIFDLPERWVSIASRVNNGRVIIQVTDCGSGIPPNVVDKMMQPFFTTKETGKGTGLGLSISKGIVETHKGRIWYEEGGPNTSIAFELPVLETPNVRVTA